MKKTILIVLGVALSLGASAQNWQDALLFSENNYSGTARGVGMGNALTAVGGDLGSITFNPAGSAVSAFSQFVITPGYTLSVANVGAAENMPSPMMDEVVNTVYGRMKLPNVGVTLNMDTGRRWGLKRMTFGVVFNSTNNFTGRYNAAGVNSDNSFAASLASSADGYAENVLASESWFYSGDPSRMPAWMDMAGYRSGMFNTVSGRPGTYQAVTEVMNPDGQFGLAAPIYQRYGLQQYGSKHDAIINFALNFSDRFYVGANLGVTTLRYAVSEYWSEMPDNPDEFPVIRYSDGTSARFESLRMKYNCRLNGAGVYFKAGFLWRPFAGLRLGGAIQTTTNINLTERYGYSSEVNLSGKYVGPVSSPEDEWIYALKTPMRVNAGLAYTFGSVGLLSADYEYANYGNSYFQDRTEYNEYSSDSFSDVNKDIRDFLGPSHQLRVGTEIRVTPGLSLRAGYNLAAVQQEGDYLLKHSFSAGFGVSYGSMFVDVAVRARLMPKEYYTLYFYYSAPNPSEYYYKDVNENFITPVIGVRSTLVDALVTLGWRF